MGAEPAVYKRSRTLKARN
jgi:hypothetical protein